MKLTIELLLVPRSKNAWSYISTPQYVFMAWCLVKHRDKCTLTFYRKYSIIHHFLWEITFVVCVKKYTKMSYSSQGSDLDRGKHVAIG
jgi:hypothetical protein